MRRAVSRFSRVSTSAVSAPGDRLAGEQQRLRKVRAHEVEVVQSGEDRASLAVPAPHQVEQVGDVLASMACERFVEHDHPRILQQQAREQHALHLPARERADRAVLETGKADGGDRRVDRARALRPMPPKDPGAAPKAHGHHVVDVDREGAVDLGGLRQVGDMLRIGAAALDAAGQRLKHADNALEAASTCRAPFGPTTATQRAALHRAVEVVHGRMPVVAEREIAELQRARSSTYTFIAQSTAPHSSAMSAAAMPSRCTTDRRRIDGKIAAGGCPWPGRWW